MRILSTALGGAALLAVSALPSPSQPPRAQSGSKQFKQGRAVFAETCAMCHGDAGRGGPAYANPIWGPGAQITKYRTAQGLFEYHQMLMPFDDPSRVPDDAKWAVTLYVLANQGVLPADGTLGPQNAGTVQIR